MSRLGWLLPLILFLCGSAQAHEVRPALIDISEQAGGRADILWKQPVVGDMAVALRPRLGDGLLDRRPNQIDAAATFRTARWSGIQLGPRGLDGQALKIDGLAQTITDVLVIVRHSNGEVEQHILTPEVPSVVLNSRKGTALNAYLRLGVEHILTGVDHLLFVLGLIFLSRSTAALVSTITAFTVAHSITLALTALGRLSLSPALVETLVALSIVFVAVELVRNQRGGSSLTQRYPWLIAFSFGLLHGSAFAGVLKEVGLPENNIPAALLLFNVGVEIGQLVFVLAMLFLIHLVRRLQLPAWIPAAARTATTYAIGSFSMFWFVERLGIALNTAA